MNAQQTRPESDALRALVIGAGPAASEMHLPVLARLRDRGEIVLAVVCDIRPERAAAAMKKFGFLERAGDAIGALDREDIDVVYILGSAQLHHEYGVTALRKGKHLFVEKPVAPTYMQAIEMVAAAREGGLIAVGGHNRRFYRSIAALRERAGKAGWQFAEAVFHKPEFGKAPQFGARTWLGANGIHALDALVFVMGGMPEHVSAVAGGSGARGPTAFSAVMHWSNGGQGTFLCNNDAGSRQEQYVFHAPGETCTLSASGLTIERDGVVEEISLPSIGDGVEAEHESFLKAIRGGESPVHSLAAIAPSLFLAERIEESFNGRIEVPRPSEATQPRDENPGKSIVITGAAELQGPLTRWLPRYRLVSIEDVEKATGPRPDISAAILGRGSTPLSPQILAKLPSLCVVGFVALSLARYEPEALLARGIALINASGAYAESVAEFALGLMILARRRAFSSHEIMRRGGWGTGSSAQGLTSALRRLARRARPILRGLGLEPLALNVARATRPKAAAAPRDLQGATIGLIGWGENALALTERLVLARARVLVYSEHAVPAEIRKSGATPASLGEVLAAEIVSLHRGLTRATRHCLGAAELQKLRPGAVLINVARAALIEPTALLERLRRGDVFACLDTFEDEPLAASHPLRTLTNVFLTSHIAGGSGDMHTEAADEVVRKVGAYLQGTNVESIAANRLRTMT